MRTQVERYVVAGRRLSRAARAAVAGIAAAGALALTFYVALARHNALASCMAAVGLFAAGAIAAALAVASGGTGAVPGVSRRRLSEADGLAAALAALTGEVREIAAGDLTRDLTVTDVALADLAGGLNRLIAGMGDFLLTMRDETGRLSAAGAGLHETAASSLAVMEGGAIAQTQLEEGSREQSDIVEGAQFKVRAMTDAIEELAGGAERQTRALDQTATNVSSMSASIEEVAAQVDSLLAISSETTLTADRGGAAIHTIVDAMTTIRTTIGELSAGIRRLGDNSDQIGDIVKVIDRIAEQTNLLALNAAIEAARAGEHGRGFAVVASEIRKLADGSVQATKEIAGHIGSTQSVIQQVTGAMSRLDERLEESAQSTGNASEALGAIVTTVKDANRQIGEISSVTRSMSENAFGVIRSIEEITGSVAANLAAAERMGSHSEEVSSAFESITSISGQNAASVEVLTYVNAEVTSAAQRILASVEEMNAHAAAIDLQLARYAVANVTTTERVPA